MEYKMKLTDEQLGILNGERGATMAKVMKTLVLFGDVFGAEKLVPVTHKQGHLVTSFGIGLLKPLFRTMDELISAVCSKGGTTIQAVESFRRDDMEGMIGRAVAACVKRAEELSE